MPDKPPVDIEALDHIGCAVPDLDAAIAWWKDMFGFELVASFEVADIGAKLAFVEKAGQCIEFIQLPETHASPTDVFTALGVVGAHHVALRVQDTAATIAELEARGVEVRTPPAEGPIGFYAFVKDVSGLFVEIIQYKT